MPNTTDKLSSNDEAMKEIVCNDGCSYFDNYKEEQKEDHLTSQMQSMNDESLIPGAFFIRGTSGSSGNNITSHDDDGFHNNDEYDENEVQRGISRSTNFDAILTDHNDECSNSGICMSALTSTTSLLRQSTSSFQLPQAVPISAEIVHEENATKKQVEALENVIEEKDAIISEKMHEVEMLKSQLKLLSRRKGVDTDKIITQKVDEYPSRSKQVDDKASIRKQKKRSQKNLEPQKTVASQQRVEKAIPSKQDDNKSRSKQKHRSHKYQERNHTVNSKQQVEKLPPRKYEVDKASRSKQKLKSQKCEGLKQKDDKRQHCVDHTAPSFSIKKPSHHNVKKEADSLSPHYKQKSKKKIDNSSKQIIKTQYPYGHCILKDDKQKKSSEDEHYAYEVLMNSDPTCIIS